MAPICIGKQRQPSRLDFLLFSIANNFLINVPETMAALRIPPRPPSVASDVNVDFLLSTLGLS